MARRPRPPAPAPAGSAPIGRPALPTPGTEAAEATQTAKTTEAADSADSADSIDALFQLPLTSFTAARNALAQTLARGGARDAAARVKALTKPAVVPWAVNQVFWHARSIWDRLVASGQAVRTAQIAALEHTGAMPAQVERQRTAVRDATAAHRTAIADAVHQAVRLAGQASVHPNTEEVARMLEALSLAAQLPGEPGRFVEIVQPAGFDALFGITPAVTLPAPRPRTGTPATVSPLQRPDTSAADRAAAEAARRARTTVLKDRLAAAQAASRAADAAERRAADALADAELRVTQAKADLRSAQSAAHTARGAHAAAEEALARLTAEGEITPGVRA